MAWSAPTEWERWNPEQLLECPYDPVHRIPAKRYQYHVIKCRKQHPEKDFVSCPFNAKHIMLRPELRQHITKCPEKSEVEPYSYKGTERDSDGFYFKGDTSVPSYRKEELSVQPIDDWDREDDDLRVNQYSTPRPSTNNQNDDIIVNPYQYSQPSTNNQVVQDILRLNPDDRERFKDNLRCRAIQNDLNPPNYQTTNTISTGLNSAPEVDCANRPVWHQSHSGCTNLTQPASLCCNGIQNNEQLSNQHGLPYNLTHGESARPQTFRGKGRARLAEEARRTQFGVSSNLNSGIQAPGFTVGRGRGMLSFFDTDRC